MEKNLNKSLISRRTFLGRMAAAAAGLTIVPNASIWARDALSAEAKPEAETVENLTWLNDYNVVWNSPSTRAVDSMPIGGGKLALNVINQISTKVKAMKLGL